MQWGGLVVVGRRLVRKKGVRRRDWIGGGVRKHTTEPTTKEAQVNPP